MLVSITCTGGAAASDGIERTMAVLGSCGGTSEGWEDVACGAFGRQADNFKLDSPAETASESRGNEVIP